MFRRQIRSYSNLLARSHTEPNGRRFAMRAPEKFGLREFYSLDLKRTKYTKTIQTPIASAKHHIIPKRALIQIWNKMIADERYLENMKSVFEELGNNPQVTSCNDTIIGLNALINADFDRLRKLNPSQILILSSLPFCRILEIYCLCPLHHVADFDIFFLVLHPLCFK